VACCLVSVWVQSIGAFEYTGLSNLAITDPADEKMLNVWKISNAPILVERRQGRAPFVLLRKALDPP
jgi:hypothetical protein